MDPLPKNDLNALQNCSEKQEFDKLLDFVLQNWKNKVPKFREYFIDQ